MPALELDRFPALARIAPLRSFWETADYREVESLYSEASVAGVLAAMLSHWPWWVRALFQARKLLVPLLRLVRHEEPEEITSLRPEDIPFEPPGEALFFQLVSGDPDSHWLGVSPPDTHLSAYFGVVAERLPATGPRRFYVVTLVHYLRWTGPVYFNLIRPFHHLVVHSMMRSAARAPRRLARVPR
jgi:hypothetical protein